MGSVGAVSVVVPNFDRGHLLGAAIRSALAQRDVEVEVLVCDDGSADSSESVVQELADARVRWLPGAGRSGGAAVPRNRGIATAQADWVAFLDSDDTWLEGKLAAQLAALAEQSADACTTNAYRCVPGADGPPPLLHPHLPASIDLARMLRANLVVTSAMVVSTTLLRDLGGFPEAGPLSIFEDYALWLRVAQRTPIVAVDQPMVAYRDESATSVRGQMQLEITCTRAALRDFRRWRAGQRPPIPTTPAERALMIRQLAALVSVRQIAARAGDRLGAGRSGSP